MTTRPAAFTPWSASRSLPASSLPIGRGIPARRWCRSQAQTGKNLLSSGIAAHSPQHSPLWWIHHPLRHRGHVHRLCRPRVQPVQRNGDGFGDSLQIGAWKLVCQSYSQDSNANYDTNFALLDLSHNGKYITRLAPERRFYNASQQPSTVVAIHSTLAYDIYTVFEGRNPDTDKPIIKVFINPLVNWIWIGVGIVIFGTFIALVPALLPSSKRIEATADAHAGPRGLPLAPPPPLAAAQGGPHA